MPEFPDIVVSIESLEARILHQRLERMAIASPFLVRSVSPRPEDVEGRLVVGLSRMGKKGFHESHQSEEERQLQ